MKDIRKILEKQKYAIVGKHSGVQICRWTRNSLNEKGVCWKEKFYGVKSHRCCQMSPALMWCDNQCLHCWRPIELNLGIDIGKEDSPKEILEGIIEARKKLLMGFKGNKNVSREKFEEALEPKLFTFSLSGEPCLYSRLGEMFKEIRKREAVSFLVTNGLHPDVLRSLTELPTQITVSTNAPNEDLFLRWCRPSIKNSWKKFLETMDVLKKLKGEVRRVIRLTLVKKSEEGNLKDLTNMSEENVEEYVSLIKRAEPDFVHVKGYKSVGWARDRMGYDKQPWFDEVKHYGLKILEKLEDYEIGAEDKRSCVVMLVRKGAKLKIEKV